jgi:serine/threonine protein kinase
MPLMDGYELLARLRQLNFQDGFRTPAIAITANSDPGVREKAVKAGFIRFLTKPLVPALEVTTQVAAGLSAVHEQNLVHRDIKPSNIMVKLKEEGAVTAKIIDLGLAKPATDAPADPAISLPGAFAGTPEFERRSSRPHLCA